MNCAVLKVVALVLLLAAAVVGAEDASQPDACSATEKAAVVKILKKLGDFLEDKELSFEDLVEEIFKKCDSNEDSFLDRGEFTACVAATRIGDEIKDIADNVSQPCWDAVLRAVDINRDGHMGELELRVLLATAGVHS